jgi:hypothetical protein
MENDKIIKARELRKVVEQVFGFDLLTKNRKREVVDSRIVYSKILREYKYSFNEIGSLLAKDHTTIMHYCNVFDSSINFLPDLKKKYLSCKKMFGREMPIEYLYTKEELIDEFLKTKEELSSLHLKYEELIKYKHKQEMEEQKWGSIYKMIRERTPIDMEDVVERRINAMFNTSYDY